MSSRCGPASLYSQVGEAGGAAHGEAAAAGADEAGEHRRTAGAEGLSISVIRFMNRVT